MIGKDKSLREKITFYAAIAAALGGLYTLMDRGLFDSFFITPKHFAVYVDLFNKRQDEQERRLIRLETIIEMSREKGAKEN